MLTHDRFRSVRAIRSACEKTVPLAVFRRYTSRIQFTRYPPATPFNTRTRSQNFGPLRRVRTRRLVILQQSFCCKRDSKLTKLKTLYSVFVLECNIFQWYFSIKYFRFQTLHMVQVLEMVRSNNCDLSVAVSTTRKDM